MHSRLSTDMLDTTARPKTRPRSRTDTLAHAFRRAATLSIPSSLVIVALVCTLVLRTASLTHVVDVPLTALERREVGNAHRGLERIAAENFTTLEELDALANEPRLPEAQRLVYRYAPLLLQPDVTTPANDDTLIGVYYLLSTTEGEDTSVTTIQYFFFSTDENGGTLALDRLALFGQPIDRELIYRVTIINGEIASAYYQAPVHRLVQMHDWGPGRPIFEVASANHNFRPVGPVELEQRSGFQLLVPLPRHELEADPAHDPDFVALAASEVAAQYGINLSHYVYVEFQNPVYDGVVTVSVKVAGRWYYLHDWIAGLTRPGYNKPGIYIGFAPDPEMIEAIRIVAYSPRDVEIEVISAFIYPRLEYLA
ncbi:MAG TPA: hypothetical protein VKZ96_13600 [Thermomicrobiales bacterium]|nr:hypothetical protein [Thermomicrobiales bacterium]